MPLAAETRMWPFMPMMRPKMSPRKPFMTLSTTISVATPSATPISANQAMNEMKPSRSRLRRKRQAMVRSVALGNGLATTQALDRIEAGRHPRRIDRGEEREQQCHEGDTGDLV